MTATVEPTRHGLALRGVALVVAISLLAALSVAFYKDYFSSKATIRLLTDRSGLLMDPGSDVKVNGVVVGSVTKVRFLGEKAELELAMDPEELGNLSTDVSARLEPTTLFGRKFVTLVAPAVSGGRTLREGEVIDASQTTVEVNDVFSTLVTVLDAVEPSKINATLTAAATALEGRGTRLGDVFARLDTYLAEFNGSIPALQADIPKVADNADSFADASPDFLRLVDNFAVTSDSIVEKQTQLNAFLLSFTNFGNQGSHYVEEVGSPLIQAVDVLDPTTKLLAQYSPEYPCFFQGMNQARRYLENTLGATRPGLNVLSTVLVGDPAYGADNLPINGASNPPSCYGAPTSETTPLPPQTNFNDGSDAYHREFTLGELAQSPLLSLLFGPDNMFGPAK